MGSGGGGGGGGNQNVETTVTQTDIPKEFYPYLQKSLQMGEALLDQPYIPYEGQRMAGYTPEQQMAFQGLTAVGTRKLEGVQGGRDYFQGVMAGGPDYQSVGTGYTGTGPFGSGYTGQGRFGGGYRARNIETAYDPTQQNFGSGYQGADITSSYVPTTFETGDLAANIERFQNPYTEMVLDRARERSQKQFDQAQADRQLRLQAQGGASAFGSRGLLGQLQAEDDFSTRQMDLEAQQLAAGFDRAAALAGSDLDRALRTQQLTDASARQAGAMDLQAQIAADAARRAGGVQALQAQQMADQAARAFGAQSLQAQQARERARQIQGSQTLQAQIARDAALRAGGAQTLQAQIARDAALRAAGQQDLTGQMANQRAYADALARGDKAAISAMEADRLEQSLDLTRLGALNALGADLRRDEQAILDQQYADFVAQRDYPMRQLEYFSGLLRGFNVPQYAPTQTTTSAPGPNTYGQLANFLLGARSMAG